MRFIYYLTFVLFFIQSANAQDALVFKDVTYKIVNKKDSIKLDVFQPTKKVYKQNPVVVFIHGGAWAKGDKNIEHMYYMRSLRDTLRNKGYGIVSINYRLVDKSTNISDQLNDCRNALQWINNNASIYNFDTQNIGLCGESAGAHLAMLLAYSNKDLDSSIENPVPIRYVIDNFGPTDLNKVLKTNASLVTKGQYKLLLPELYDIREKLIRAMTTYDINENKEFAMAVAKDYSPIHYIENGNKTPIMILHGTKDFVVPIKQSKNFKKILDQQNISNEFVKVKKGNHGFRNIPNNKIQELITDIASFVQKHTSVN